jgi:hypothetical protein
MARLPAAARLASHPMQPQPAATTTTIWLLPPQHANPQHYLHHGPG